ncbi:hypothetical protein NMG60_11003103 [Bertholletia excelsa]
MAAKLRRRTLRLGLRRKFFWQVAFLRRCLRTLWNRILTCTNTADCRSHQYRQLSQAATVATATFSSSPPLPFMEARNDSGELASMYTSGHEKDSSDLVSLKISILGDCHIGKTSFLRKYVGEEIEQGLGVSGLNRMDKTSYIKGARIAYSIWDVEGDENSQNHIPTACKDSVAMLFMFDLTSRCTLNRLQRHRVVQESQEVESECNSGANRDQVRRFCPAADGFAVDNCQSGKNLCQGAERHPFLLECNLQHQRKQGLQVHHSQALQPAMGSRAKSNNRRAHNRLLDVGSDGSHVPFF